MSLSSVVYIISYAFVVFAIEKFMKVFFEKRRTSIYIYIASCLAYLTVISTAFLLLNIPIINLLCNIIFLFILTLNYEAIWRKRFIAIFIIYIFMFVADLIVVNLTEHVYKSIIERVEYDAIFGFVAISLIIYIEALLAQNFKNIRKNNPVSIIFWISSFVFPVSSIFILIVALNNASQYQIVISIIVIFVMNVLTFYLNDSLSSAYDHKLKSKLYEQEREYYYNQCELMRSSVEEIKSFKHDVSNHLSTLCNYIDANQSQNALNYIIKLIGEVKSENDNSHTGNIAFDSIINYKLRNAKENDIDLDVKVLIPQKLKIEVIDVVTIIGNLLDNAIDAVMKVSNKRISLNISYSKGTVLIFIENTFDGEIIYENNEIISNKKSDGHGFGLKNIKKSLEKYNGCMELQNTDSIFSIEVLFYAQEQ